MLEIYAARCSGNGVLSQINYDTDKQSGDSVMYGKVCV